MNEEEKINLPIDGQENPLQTNDIIPSAEQENAAIEKSDPLTIHH